MLLYTVFVTYKLQFTRNESIIDQVNYLLLMLEEILKNMRLKCSYRSFLAIIRHYLKIAGQILPFSRKL